MLIFLHHIFTNLHSIKHQEIKIKESFEIHLLTSSSNVVNRLFIFFTLRQSLRSIIMWWRKNCFVNWATITGLKKEFYNWKRWFQPVNSMKSASWLVVIHNKGVAKCITCPSCTIRTWIIVISALFTFITIAAKNVATSCSGLGTVRINI